MNLLSSILTHLGLSHAHTALAEAAVSAAPTINPEAPHTDWHTIAVDKFKQLAKTLLNKDVEHYAANVLIGFVFGQIRAKTSTTFTPVVDAAEKAARDAADTAIAKGLRGRDGPIGTVGNVGTMGQPGAPSPFTAAESGSPQSVLTSILQSKLLPKAP